MPRDVRRFLPSFRGGPHIDNEVLGDWLAALGAHVSDAAQHVQFRHVPSRTSIRNLITDRAIAVDMALGAVSREARDVDEVELLEATFAHVVGIHEEDGAEALEA